MNKAIVTILFCFFMMHASAQTIATFEVSASSSTFQTPIKVNLDEITHLADSALALIEIVDKKRVPVFMQVEHGHDHRELHWLAGPGKAGKRIFELIKSSNATTKKNSFTIKQSDGALVIASDKNLLQYNYKTVYPPAGIDSSFSRSAFIHPLWSPRGQVLTRIQPPDHYHHYGIWNPWTHFLFRGDTLDFWNLNKKQGTVRFANFISTKTGDVFAEYSALHEHVSLKNNNEEVILNEVQRVRTFSPEKSDYYIADITISMNCATADPILLLEYRYGGFGWRTTEQWSKDNSTVLTSEGKSRKEADGSKARWCMVQGKVDNENAGVVMMSYPTNYNHPEPLRIWPENQYDRGDMFANFSPTKDRDWLLEPGKNYILKYRLLVFNGVYDQQQAEQAWRDYAAPPKVVVKVNGSK